MSGRVFLVTLVVMLACGTTLVSAQSNKVSDANCNVQRLRTESVTTSSGLWGGMNFLVQLHFETCTDLTTNAEGEVTGKESKKKNKHHYVRYGEEEKEETEAPVKEKKKGPVTTGSRILLTIDNETHVAALELEAEDEDSEEEGEVEYKGTVRIPGKDDLGGVTYFVTVDEEGVVRMSSKILFRDSEDTEMPLCEKSRIGNRHACYVENLMPTLIVFFFLIPAALMVAFLFRAKQKKDAYLQDLRQEEAVEMKKKRGGDSAPVERKLALEEATLEPTPVITLTVSKVDPKCSLKPSEVDVVTTAEKEVLLSIKFTSPAKGGRDDGYLQVLVATTTDSKEMHLWQRRGHATQLVAVDSERAGIKMMAQAWTKLQSQHKAKPVAGTPVPDFDDLLGQQQEEAPPEPVPASTMLGREVSSSSPPPSKQSTQLFRDDSSLPPNTPKTPSPKAPSQTMAESEKKALDAAMVRKAKDEEAAKAKKKKEEEQRKQLAQKKEHDGQVKSLVEGEQSARTQTKNDENAERTTVRKVADAGKKDAQAVQRKRVQLEEEEAAAQKKKVEDEARQAREKKQREEAEARKLAAERAETQRREEEAAGEAKKRQDEAAAEEKKQEEERKAAQELERRKKQQEQEHKKQRSQLQEGETSARKDVEKNQRQENEPLMASAREGKKAATKAENDRKRQEEQYKKKALADQKKQRQDAEKEATTEMKDWASKELDDRKELEKEERQDHADSKDKEQTRLEDEEKLKTPERPTKEEIPESARKAHFYMGFSLAEVKLSNNSKVCIIDSLDKQGPADLAGLELDDEIVTIGSQEISGSMKKVKEAITGVCVGDALPVRVLRGEAKKEVSCTLIPLTDESAFKGKSYYFDKGSAEKIFSPQGRPPPGSSPSKEPKKSASPAAPTAGGGGNTQNQQKQGGGGGKKRGGKKR